MMRINDELDGGYQNNIHAYQFYRMERYIYLLAQNSKSMYKFLQSTTTVKNEHPDLFDFRFDIKSLNCANKIKYCILNNKLFYVSYFFARTIYMGKLSWWKLMIEMKIKGYIYFTSLPNTNNCLWINRTADYSTAFWLWINGLVSSISQFLNYITLLECDIPWAIMFFLHKHLAEKRF